MKHIHRALCAVLIMFLAVGLFSGLTPVRAEEQLTDGSYYYVDLGEEFEITGYVPDVLSGEITLPVSFQGKPVTSIKGRAFRGMGGVTRINVPDQYTLGDYALSNMPDLKQIMLTAKHASCEARAFAHNSKLEMIYIQGQISTLNFGSDMGIRIFVDLDEEAENVYDFKELRQISQTHYDPFTAQMQTEGDFSYVVYDGKATIMSAPQTGSVTIPETLGGAPVCYLDGSLFYGSDVSSITLPDTVEELPSCVFKDSVSLKQIDLSHVHTVGRYAFYGTALSELTLAEGCTSIGAFAFYKSALTGFSLPDSITEIGTSAFNNLTNAKLRRLPASLKSVGEFAFFHTKIEDTTIPASLQTIQSHAFCSSFEGTICLPEGLRYIGAYAFGGCRISTLEIPGTVLELESTSLRTPASARSAPKHFQV